MVVILMHLSLHVVVAASPAGVHPALLPRFALSPPAEHADPGLQVVIDAVMQTVVRDERALWFVVPRDAGDEADATDTQTAPDEAFITDLTDTAWTRHQAEVLVFLDVRSVDSGDDPVGRGSRVRVQARLYRVRPPQGTASRGLAFWEQEVQIDAAGRYLRPAVWQELAEAIMEHADIARPIVDLTVASNGPVELSGLPEWAEVRETQDGHILVRLRSLREYRVTVSRPGYRTEEITVYMERTPVRLRVDLTRYPRHTVAATVRGLAWPGVEYGWYHSQTNWTARVGVTSFLVGLTPLRQVRNESAEARIISSYGLTEIEVGGHRFFRDRDEPHRITAGIGGVVRLVHRDTSFGLDPAIPWTVRPTAGWEWELSRRLILSQSAATDLFVSPRSSFVRGEVWLQRIGPVFWQLPIYRVGLRVQL